jgi:hypothetical protein
VPEPRNTPSPAEKRRVDEKLDDALEESFPGSDPASISQPTSDEKAAKAQILATRRID